MRLLIFTFFIAAGSVVFSNMSAVVMSAEQAIATSKILVVDEIAGPEVSAIAYGVFDIQTGEMLFSENADTSLPIASIAKLFTAAATLNHQARDEEVTVTHEDVSAEGRAGKLIAGQTYKLRELIFPLLLESSNDAARTLKGKIKEIPFADKVLADGSGLSSQNTATVNELSDEIRRVYLKDPHIFDITTLKQYVGEYTGWVNNSPVRDLPGYKGGKHGYTEAANRTLVAIFSEDSLEDRELGYILLGSDAVRADVEELRSFVVDSVQLK